MGVQSIEDIFQWVFDNLTRAFRTRLIHGGTREHEEQLTVPPAYTPANNKIEFSSSKRFIRIVSSEDMFWVDSATDDTDAESKLTSAGSRGVIPSKQIYDLALAEGITRLDFLAIGSSGSVFVTGLD